eukprot:RCo001932
MAVTAEAQKKTVSAVDSVRDVLVALTKSFFLSKKLEGESTSSGDGYFLEFQWPSKDPQTMTGTVRELVQAMARELSGQQKITIGTDTAPQVIHFDKDYPRKELMSILSETTKKSFQGSAFDESANTGILLELAYRMSVAETKDPFFVTTFPKVMWRQPALGLGLGASDRIDLVANGQVVACLCKKEEGEGPAKCVCIVSMQVLAALFAEARDIQQVARYLPKEWSAISEAKVDDIPELLEMVRDSLNTLFQSIGRRAQKRVLYLMNLVGSDLIKYIQLFVPKVWEDDFSSVRMKLESALLVCKKWAGVTKELTTGTWEEWSGGPYEDPSLANMGRRIEQVLGVRSLIEQISSLLGDQVLSKDILAALKAFNPLALFCQAEWESAFQAFQDHLGQFDQSIVAKLRAMFSDKSSIALVEAFRAHGEIVKRPEVQRALSQSREQLFAAIQENLQSIKSSFGKKSPAVAGKFLARKMDPNVQLIAWTRQQKHGVQLVIDFAESLLSNLSKSEDMKAEANTLLGSMDTFEQECFGTWKSSAQKLVEDIKEPLYILMTGNMLQRRDGKISVVFDERLSHLFAEVRQLQALGFAVPTDIQVFAANAAQFYNSFLNLKHITNFYNGMDVQILKCHRMLLNDLVTQLEEAAIPQSGEGKKKKPFAWNAAAEVENYCNRLAKLSSQVSLENRRLRRTHAEIAERICALMNTDLLRFADKWKSALKEMREKFGAYDRTHHRAGVETWKRHWDCQLYKALEYQYQFGMESLNENLEELKCDLVFNQGMLQFRPMLETMRELYYQKMKEFLTIPTRFRGLANSEFFHLMPEKNEKAITAVYAAAESVFGRLNKLKKSFKPWVVLGSVDLETFVVEHLTTVEEWKSNYEAVKEKQKQLEKVEETVRVDCITVSIRPFKAAVEDLHIRLIDSIQHAVRLSAQGDVKLVNEFLDLAMQKLSLRPSSLDDISAANEAYAEMNAQRADLQSRMNTFESKNRLLRSMGFSPVDLATVETKWDRFLQALDAHAKMVDSQLEKMCGAVEQNVKKFGKEVSKFVQHWNASKPRDISQYASRDEVTTKCVDFMKEKRSELDDFKNRALEFKRQCEYFKLASAEFAELDQMEVEFILMEEKWTLYETFYRELAELAKEDWLTFRSKAYRFDDFVKGWLSKLGQPSNDIAKKLKEQCEVWNDLGPSLKYLRGDGMTPDHWAAMFKLLELEKGITAEKLQFGHFVEKADLIIERLDQIKALHLRAQGEIQIREALQELRQWGNDCVFQTFVRPEGGRNIALVKDWKDITTAVSDKQALLSSLKDSPYFGSFAEEAQGWEQKLTFLDQCLPNLNLIQRKWLYLEPIFGRGALPAEQGRFRRVDKEFVSIMKDIQADPRVTALTKKPELENTLPQYLEQLDRCQKALNEFLEEKRDRFPRFYFIGDDDMLEILGQAQNPAVIQSHLKKLFAGISRVEFSESMTEIIAMCSSAGEVVPLNSPVLIKPEVDMWLGDLDVQMRATLKDMLVQCLANWDIQKHPAQVLCLREMEWFTAETEKNIKAGSLPTFKTLLQQKLAEFTQIESAVSKVMELKTKALILDLIHNIEVVSSLIDAHCKGADEWPWQKQLRYYMNSEKSCLLRMVDAEFQYTYEYQGNAPRLVHTPLTDKCYLTLTQGMHLGYGGNPYGPAGTGKTESVKALGNAMGRQVLVFNCDEGIDFKSMGRIFMGLCKCGAWGCFDEFNRLKEDQLSAISDMIQVIQAALKARESQVFLLGRNVDLNPSAGIFVTLNPAGKNYGGRSKLPENLKLLFRAVAMTVPDTGLICEVELYSEGFVEAKPLGKKLVEAFNLCRDLLSQQQHYDWGLRALKMILKTAGSMKRAERRIAMSPPTSPDKAPPPLSDKDTFKAECEIVMKASRVNTLSKLTFEDAVRFNEIMADVFPGVGIVDISNEDLLQAIRDCMGAMKLQVIDSQINKIMQLNEAMLQRMGVCVVGPSGSGKSTLIKCLQKAYARLGQPIPMRVMNPKAMPRQQLLGFMDADTREWNDGVLTMAARKVMEEPAGVRSWIVCDGDIDPEWVESLNSVLDDNRLLTMPSGERIQFGDNVNFIFETHSLAFASPATVSRMSVIYLSEEDVDPHSAVKSWLANMVAPENQAQLAEWIDKYFYEALDRLVGTRSLVVETTQMGLVLSGLSQLHLCKTLGEFALGLIRGFGSYLSREHRADYAKGIFKLCGQSVGSKPLDIYWDETSGSFQTYQYTPQFKLKAEDLLRNPMIDTVDVQRNLDICKGWIGTRPFLLVGPEGCGKTMLLLNLFANQKNTKVAIINCSAQTNCNHVIQKLNQACNSWNTPTGRVLRPKDCERLVLFLKDLNLPKPDMYATTQLHAFLQQLILYEGYYASNLEWIGVQHVQIVASMNPQGGVGRYPLVTRFTAITCICSVSYPDREQLQTIYSEYLHGVVSSPPLDSHPKWGSGGSQMKEIAAVMVSIYDKVKSKYNVDEKSHYIFTPRDLTNWVTNLRNYDLADVDLMEVIGYEAQRIFADRLVSEDHRSRFERIMNDELSKLGYDAKRTQQKLFVPFAGSVAAQGKSDAKPKEDGKKKEGGEKHEEGGKSGERRRVMRKLLSSIAKGDLEAILERGLVTYAREYRKLDLMLIDETILWICRAARVLSQPGGSILFSGRPGVGRRNITCLVAYMLRMVPFTLSMGKDYGLKQFKNELKSVLQTAGIANEEVCFVIEDHNLVQPEFIEMLNSLLSSGEVPGLYSPEEQNLLLAPLVEECQAEGFFGGAYNLFLNRIQSNVHVVLLFDPEGPDYELRCQSNPAIYTRCGILWIDHWSHEGMRMIPRIVAKDLFDGFTKDLESRAGGDEAKLKELTAQAEKRQNALQENLLAVHRTVGRAATPRDYVQFLKAYARTFSQQHKEVSDHRNRLRSGLSKLREAEANVDELKRAAEDQAKTLAQKQEQADKALEEIQQNMEKAGEQKKDAEALRGQLAVESKEMEGHKAEIERQLSSVQPILDQAKDAVGRIKADNLNEIKALKMPPEAIRDVLEGVLAIMGVHDTSWVSMKKFLSQRGMIQSILEFDAHNITPESRQQVKNLIATKSNSFKPEVITRASVAAAPLAAWAVANIEYSVVLEKVGPLEAELARLQQGLERSQTKLNETEEKIKTLDANVAEMKKRFKKLTQEAEKLRLGLEAAEATLKGATELFGKLVGEKGRWEEQVKVLNEELDQLGNLSMLSAAYMTYIASEDENKRRKMLTEWKKRLGVSQYVFKDFMRTESALLAYKSEGLPADDLSVDNGIVILESPQTCLIIDPAQQAIKWLKTHLQKKNITVETTTAVDERFQTTLELAVRFGKTLIVSEVDRVEPVLYPILRGDVMVSGTKGTVLIGEKNVDWQENFRLYLITRNPNLVLPPDAAALVTVVNFAITRSGLEGQLLGLTLQHEKPELESQKSALLKQEEEYKLQLAELEETLLKQLATSEGSLLENKALIDALNQIKASATVVTKSLEESKVLQESLDKQREEYRPFANIGSTIFFLVQDLSSINHMYQFALASFIRLFMKALHDNKDPAVAEVSQKIPQLNRSLISSSYFYVARSLFKQDRLLFGLHMCFGVRPAEFPEEQWQHFGNLGVFVTDPADASSCPPWVGTDTVAAFQALRKNLPTLFGKLDIQEQTYRAWQDWLKQAAPETCVNMAVKQELTLFEQNLVVATFRPDRLPVSLEILACRLLELESLTPPAMNLASIAKEVSATEPVLMITTPGADPSQEWAEIAQRVVGTGKFTQLAMGGGQTDEAINLLRQAAHSGDWLLLKNLHLVVAWVDTLEKEFTNLAPAEGFRLWLTSEPHDAFPGILLRSSLKITFQSPPGIRKNLLRTYDMWTPEFLEQGSVLRARILLVLAFFHAICMERRTYIPQGWVKFYEFSVADLKTASEIISAQCSAHETPDWNGVYGLLENAIYGGRMDNDFDIRILLTYLHKYFNTQMVGSSSGSKLSAGLVIPNSNKHADFMEAVRKFPNVDSPDFFGLPPNADRLVQKSFALKAVENLKRLKDLQVGVSGAFDREVWALGFKPLFELWEGLTAGNKEILERKEMPKKEMPAVSAFIHMEAVSAYNLVTMVGDVFAEIQRVVAGTALLTQKIQTVAKFLLSGAVPPAWDRAWEGPENIQMWLRYMVQRAVALQDWLKRGSGLLTQPIRLNQCYRPVTMLNALRQETARKSGQPLDLLTLTCAWGDGATVPGAAM